MIDKHILSQGRSRYLGLRDGLRPRPRPRGALLDIDGTLLDSNDAHAGAWLEAFEGEGIALGFDAVRRQIGKGGEALLWSVLHVPADGELGRTIARHKAEIFKARYLPDLAPFPRARELLERMRASGLSLHVATSARGEEVADLLRQAGVSDLVEQATTGDDAARSKPDPDIVNAAVLKSGLARAELMMLGDTPYDIHSALTAGVPIVALRSGGWQDASLLGAEAIYDDVAALLEQWDDSPFCWPAEPSRHAPHPHTEA